jgi:hypothetical protein
MQVDRQDLSFIIQNDIKWKFADAMGFTVYPIFQITGLVR